MSSGFKSRRAAKREETRFPVRVKCHESETDEWEELTETLNVSPFGALLRISRPKEPGRLLHLTLPMPRRLRCYDHQEEQYHIWSLVRTSSPFLLLTKNHRILRLGLPLSARIARQPTKLTRGTAMKSHRQYLKLIFGHCAKRQTQTGRDQRRATDAPKSGIA